VNAWIDHLIEEGLPASVVNAPGVRGYLSWQARMRVAQRMDEVARDDAIGQEVQIRMERDPVLTEAVHLLDSARTQKELFAESDKVRAEEEAPHLEKAGTNR